MNERTPDQDPADTTAELPSEQTSTDPVAPLPSSSGPEPGQGSGPGRGMRRIARAAAPLLAAGLLGGGIAAGVAVAVDDDTAGGTTTIVEAAATSAGASDQANGAEQDGGGEDAAELTGLTSTSDPALPAPDLPVQEIYRRAAPGVVTITTNEDVPGLEEGGELPFPDEPPFNRPFGRSGLGSGFVLDKAGHIVTNFHVVAGADEVYVTFADDDRVKAEVLGTDPSSDLAVLQIDAEGRALAPLPLGDSDDVQVGDTAVAIGNPFGLDRTLTKGVVSAIGREIRAPDRFAIDDVIQTDAAINHGNSGGPLLDGQGRVIGVNSQISSGGVDGNVGIGFAVPVNTVKTVATQLIENGKVERAFLGVSLVDITPDLADTVRVPVDEGVLVTEIEDGSPADDAGLEGGSREVVINGQPYVLGGDVITAIDGEKVTSSDDIRAAIASKKPDDEIEIEINRDGETKTLTATLGRRQPPPTD